MWRRGNVFHTCSGVLRNYPLPKLPLASLRFNQIGAEFSAYDFRLDVLQEFGVFGAYKSNTSRSARFSKK